MPISYSNSKHISSRLRQLLQVLQTISSRKAQRTLLSLHTLDLMQLLKLQIPIIHLMDMDRTDTHLLMLQRLLNHLPILLLQSRLRIQVIHLQSQHRKHLHLHRLLPRSSSRLMLASSRSRQRPLCLHLNSVTLHHLLLLPLLFHRIQKLHLKKAHIIHSISR